MSENTEQPKKVQIIRKSTVTKIIREGSQVQTPPTTQTKVIKVVRRDPNGSVVKTTSFTRIQTTVDYPIKPKVSKPTLKSKENQERLKKSIELKRKMNELENKENFPDERTNSINSDETNSFSPKDGVKEVKEIKEVKEVKEVVKEEEKVVEKKKVHIRDYSKKFTKDDFEYGKELGKGAYSKVYYTKYKKTGEVYATKVISQQLLIQNNQVKTGKHFSFNQK
jgi:hypothetical protein